MRNPYLLFTALLLTAGDVPAQLTYQRSIGNTGGDAASAIITTDGGYFMVGTTATLGAGDDQFHLVKLDENGDTLWTRSYGGNADDYASGVARTGDGGYMAYGHTESFGAADKDLMLLRTDANGGVQWARRFAGSGNDYARAIAPTGTGDGFLICGSTYEGAGVVDAFAVRLNSDGDTLWTRVYGGLLEDNANFLLPTGDGGFILCGVTLSSGAGATDVLVIKCQPNGDVQWARTYGGPGDDYAFHIEEATSGGYVLAGTSTSSGAGSYDTYLLKIDADGTPGWAATFGSADTDIAACVGNTTDGGYVLYGQSFGFGTASDLYLVHTDGAGGHLWSRTYGGSGYEFECNLLNTPDDGFLFCGGEESFSGARNAYLIKTDANGNSGCNEGTPATVAGLISPAMGTPALSVSHLAITATTINGTAGYAGTSTTLCSTAGIASSAPQAALRLFPTPSGSTVRLEGTERDGSIVVLDMAGRVCVAMPSASGSTTIDAGALHVGPYVLRYTHAGNSTALRMVRW